MPNVASWVRQKDEKWFRPFFDKQPDVTIRNALTEKFAMSDVNGLLLTGGSDIAPEFLNQEIPDPSVLDPDVDPERDRWEFQALREAMSRGLPVLAICKGLQVLNVALGGTLRLDISGHNLPQQKNSDIQALRNDRAAGHRFEKVNSSHHQAVDRLADGCVVEAWCATDDIVEQFRVRDYGFALAVQYHPERGEIYDGLFDDFFARIRES